MTLPPKPPARAALAGLGLGRLAYLAWHAPKAWIDRSRREGGPWVQWVNHRARLQMIAAASTLPPVARPPADAPEICFLTGKKFWYQTAFCAWSLQRVADRPLRMAFYDDGSFDSALATEARRIFPDCTIVTAAAAGTTLDRTLPTVRFPALRGQRLTYLHLRKLTDFHGGRHGWRAVLDSDMLFFRRPDALLAWLETPDRPIHMVDVANAYGYPDAALQALVTAPLPAKINVGICGLRSDALDWPLIEKWCAQLLWEHGTSYYLEQALIALILAGQDRFCLDAHDYRLLPDDAECRRPTAVLHHYVAESKRGYFRQAWRHIHPLTK